MAARRAARFADHFMPTLPELFEVVPRRARPPRQARSRVRCSRTAGNFLYVAEDPDAAWQRIAPHAMHEMNAYGKWMAEAGTAGPYAPIDDADALRALGPVRGPDTRRADRASRAAWARWTSLLFHPLMGGMDPELSWASLRLFERAVLPRLRERA